MSAAQQIELIITGARQVAAFVAQQVATSPEQTQTMQAVERELATLLSTYSR